jgi:hypothetical protein
VSLSLNPVDLFRVLAGFTRDWITAMAGGATQADRILAVFKFLKRIGSAVLMHRLDHAVTGDTPVEFRRASYLLRL